MKKTHILSLVVIIVMAFFAIATSRPPDYKIIYDKVTHVFDGEYLFIKIDTNDDPEYYVVEDDAVQVNFEGIRKYQVFINEDAYGKNLSRHVIVDYPNESEVINCGEYVFETFVENNFFIIKIKKEYLISTHVKMLYVDLINTHSNAYNKKEKYWNR
jgi:hypothetical protein